LAYIALNVNILYEGRGDMKSYSSKEVISILKGNGWYLSSTKGDHHQFKHPTKPGKTTVPHPRKDLGITEIKSISKQSGIQF